MSDVEESLPSATECDNLCKNFSKITAANSVEAMMFLQQHDWNLERAVQSYFESGYESSAATTTKVETPANAEGASSSSKPVNLPGNPNEISVLTWNLDGLDDVSLLTRTRAAVGVIMAECADVVFLQEVVARSWDIISRDTNALYHSFPACTHSMYYTVVLLKKGTVLVDKREVKPFHSSMMERKLQIVHANIKGIDVKLMNTHLESTAAHAVERLRQLKICFGEITNSDSKVNVIFGGDLNLGARDTVTVPPKVVDVWEATGSKTEKKFTWDMKYNDNKEMSGGGKPRCRFDRMYFRPAENKQVHPVEFHLRGIERVKDCSRFPSDHWAILCKFYIKTE